MAKSSAAGLAAAGIALAGVLALAGCGPAAPTPKPEQTSASTAAPAPTSTAVAEPALVKDGTAAENQPYFDKVNREYTAVNGMGFGLNIAQNLINSGFQKQDMEATADRTAIDLQADTIIVSVRIKNECLIGSFHAETYTSAVLPLLGTGGCLVGSTVAIP